MNNIIRPDLDGVRGLLIMFRNSIFDHTSISLRNFYLDAYLVMHPTNKSKNSRTEGSIRNFPENTAYYLLRNENSTYNNMFMIG